MPEYIESICRRCFHSYVCEQFNEHRDSNNQKCHFFNDHFVPIADVAPVVHGRWISLTDCANAGVYCSVCHKKVWKEDYAWCNRKNELRSNYCPHCGARMDGGKDAR